LILDLEAHPTGTAIKQIKVEAIPAKPRIVQNGLFVPLSPEPEKLELTLARISAVVGEENIGSPEVLDTHRPDAFRVIRFELTGRRTVFPSSQRRGGCASRECREATFESADGVVRNDTISQNDHPGASRHPSFSRRGISFPSSLALRIFRPPLDATVQLRNSLPTWIAFRGVHGPIETVSGPWRTSGDWWRPNTWDREEWDIELLDSLYRIYFDVHTDRWFAQGVYD
jgi:protein ImuB